MRIKRIITQHRRDMHVDYECEHCGCVEENKSAYDDTFFHENVVPSRVCPDCKKTAGNDYRPLTTKYPDGVDV